MAYIPHTEDDVRAMMDAIGIKGFDELFPNIPKELILKEPLPIPTLTEYDVDSWMEKRASENNVFNPGRSFLGAGAGRHVIPAAVAAVALRGEFLTSYTPYQAEASQGTLQAIFEFQSHICALSGMEVANASMYDGSTALAEALLMAIREKRVDRVLLPELLQPEWREVCQSYLKGLNVRIDTIPANGSVTDWSSVTADKAAAVVVQTPNAFGAIEDGAAAREAADRCGALLVAACNPISLAVLAPPADWGADIAVGEAQPMGLPVNFGGPWAGWFACTKKLIRKMPGRIVGQTKDRDGNDGFVLTLQTREQHIRRDKATSNICTNQGLCALMVTIWVSLLGKNGIIEIAESSMANLRQLIAGIQDKEFGRLYDNNSAVFHEAVIELPINAEAFYAEMKNTHGIIPGFPISRWYRQVKNSENLLLVNCTELNREADIDAWLNAAQAVLQSNSAATLDGKSQ